jgi:catechol-2,3-dioxygenase
MIRGLHHNAYRCRDSEETRQFYQDFLGLPLANAFEITETRSGRSTRVLHSFYAMEDGSFLAFFEVPDSPFDFKEQHDYDLHIALEVPFEALAQVQARARSRGMECRGIADHGFIDSIYLRDPNGYVIELTAKRPDHETQAQAARKVARANLDRWQRDKQAGDSSLISHSAEAVPGIE